MLGEKDVFVTFFLHYCPVCPSEVLQVREGCELDNRMQPTASPKKDSAPPQVHAAAPKRRTGNLVDPGSVIKTDESQLQFI